MEGTQAHGERAFILSVLIRSQTSNKHQLRTSVNYVKRQPWVFPAVELTYQNIISLLAWKDSSESKKVTHKALLRARWYSHLNSNAGVTQLHQKSLVERKCNKKTKQNHDRIPISEQAACWCAAETWTVNLSHRAVCCSVLHWSHCRSWILNSVPIPLQQMCVLLFSLQHGWII